MCGIRSRKWEFIQNTTQLLLKKGRVAISMIRKEINI